MCSIIQGQVPESIILLISFIDLAQSYIGEQSYKFMQRVSQDQTQLVIYLDIIASRHFNGSWQFKLCLNHLWSIPSIHSLLEHISFKIWVLQFQFSYHLHLILCYLNQLLNLNTEYYSSSSYPSSFARIRKNFNQNCRRIRAL